MEPVCTLITLISFSTHDMELEKR